MRNVAVATLLLAVAGSLQAQPLNGSPTGLTSPAYTIDFNASIGPDNTPVTNQYAGQNVLFSGGWNYGNTPYGGGAYGDGALYNFQPCCSVPLWISFTTAVNGAAFNFESNDGISTFTAYLSGNQVATFSGPTSVSTAFLWYGFNNITLDQIRIDPESLVNGAAGIDNLQVGSRVVATPEPASLALLGTGLFAIAGIGARRRTRG